jgi:basic amino acid/polyamine antiporter, APA family
MSWLDLLLLNVVSFGGAWSIIYALTYVPYYGGDPAFSLILTAPGILALLGIYYIFTTSMPRSGGDYVFTSRVLHPSIGLAANFVGYAAFLWFWIGDAASVFSSQGLAQTLSVYGSLTGASWASNAASWFAVPANNFLLGTLFIVFFASVVIFRTRLYFLIQNVFMTVAVIGLVIIAALVVGAAVNPSWFASSFNSYAVGVGAHLTPNAYQNLTASGTPPADTSVTNIWANLALVPFWFTVLFWVFVSNYLGGETKNARSTVKRAMFGSFGIVFIATLVILEAAYKGLGIGFITGANNIYYGYTANPFGGVLPQLTLFSAILAGNPILVLFLGIGIVAGFILVAPQSMILMSRILFSYSFDRVAPMRLADVSDRFHTPIKAILVAAIGGEVMLAFLSGVLGGGGSYTALSLYTYAGLATISLTFTFVAISAILFPYRRKELYETASVVKRKVGGVPVVTWLGIISLVYIILGTGYYFYNNTFYTFGCPGGGAAGCDFNYFLIALPVAFVATMLFYFVVRAYRSRGGIPYDMMFKEIPPE